MAHIFDGLTGYEQVLLVCGMALFVVALVALIAAIVRGKSYAGVVALFSISMAMMGFVRVQSITIDNATLQLDAAVTPVQNSPTDPAARTKLLQVVSNLEVRHWSDPEVLTKLATAQHILGQTEAAKANLNKALAAPVPPADAVALQKRFQLEDSIPQLTQKVEAGDANAKVQLQENLSEITKTPPANPTTLTNIAKAQSALGNQQEALSNVNKALKINPKLGEAVAVEQNVRAKIPGGG
jgi:tetratricopeptide (TPR) repeat protein